MSLDFCLKVTKSAQDRIRHLVALENSPELKLRISVDSGGCSGLSYRYELTSILAQEDTLYEASGTELIIDEISKTFLQNSTLDYVENLGGSFFQIINPNAKLKCGCGSSFAV
jgi:iron-sulfur cluster insertion protein